MRMAEFKRGLIGKYSENALRERRAETWGARKGFHCPESKCPSLKVLWWAEHCGTAG